MMIIPVENLDKEAPELPVDPDVELEAVLETALLELKERPEDVELVDSVFRAVDKLKVGK